MRLTVRDNRESNKLETTLCDFYLRMHWLVPPILHTLNKYVAPAAKTNCSGKVKPQINCGVAASIFLHCHNQHFNTWEGCWVVATSSVVELSLTTDV